MTALRMRMDNDMLVRGMAERTRETYLAAVARLARHYRRSPDHLSPQEVQAWRKRFQSPQALGDLALELMEATRGWSLWGSERGILGIGRSWHPR